MAYQVKLEQFEGPFDLLLFFIERDELDIYDIPIAKLTEDYLAYIRELERLDIDVASEFILVAATLMRIKAKMLLPRKAVDEEGNVIDPRDELVERLIEYKKYKSVISNLREMEAEQTMKVGRGNIKREVETIAMDALVDIELETLSLYGLMNAFKKVMQSYKRDKDRKLHTVMRYNYTIKEQSNLILNRVSTYKKTTFNDIFSFCKNRIHAIVTFLAILELLNKQKLKIYNGHAHNDFFLYKKNSTEEE